MSERWKHLAYRSGHFVNSVLRNLPYPLKRRVLDFAPTPVPRDADLRLIVLSEPRTFLDSLWTTWSWLHHLDLEIGVTLYIDGVCTEDQHHSVQRLFPGAELCDAREVIEALPAGAADLRRFGRENIYGRKVAMLLSVQQRSHVLFSDPDILVFRAATEIIENLHGAHVPLYCEEFGTAGHDPWILEKLERRGLPHLRNLNSGLLYLPRGCLDFPLAAELLEGWDPAQSHRFTEQALVSTLMAKASARPLPASRYITSWNGMWYWQRREHFPDAVLRHYFGVVRHLLYLEGMPRLVRERRRSLP